MVKTASRWQQFVIESLSHSNDSFKTAEYYLSESNDCFYEWFSESVIHPSQRFGFGFEHKMKQKQHSRSCHIAELTGAFLLAYLEIYKLAACILKHLFIMLIYIYIYIYIYIIIMMIDKNQVQSHYVDECNCIHDRKDASRNELLHVLEVVKLIQL